MVLTQSQQAAKKTNMSAEEEALNLAVAGSYNDDGNLEVTTLKNNVHRELSGSTIQGDSFPVTVITKLGIKYKIYDTGRIDLDSGIIINLPDGKDDIVFVRGITNSELNSTVNAPVQLTTDFTQDLKMNNFSGTITWESNNTNIAIVDNTGKVTMTVDAPIGTAEITASAENGIVGECDVKVVDSVANAKIDNTLVIEKTLEVQGGNSLTITLDNITTLEEITYSVKEGSEEVASISDENVGDVNFEEVTENTEVTIIITGKISGLTQELKVNVQKPMPLAKDVLVINNNVSPYVNYVDGNGNTILCRVLYNDVDGDNIHGLQIISNAKVKDISLGYNDLNYIDDSSLTREQRALESYNNAIQYLNNEAESYINTDLVYDARCLGSISTISNNLFFDKDSENLMTNPKNYQNLERFVNDGCMGKDDNYLEDCSQLGVLNMESSKEYFWLASRDGLILEKQGYFYVRFCGYAGNLAYTQNYNLSGYYQSSLVSSNLGWGLRPVFLLKNDVRISGGSGTSGSPYVLYTEN